MFDELLTNCMLLVNLPYTILLVLALVYWTTVILGVLDFNSADADLHVDGDVHGALEGGAHADGDGADGHTGGDDIVSGLLKLAGIGEVPIMIVISIASLVMWASSVMTNYHFNSDGALWVGAVILVPNLILGFGFARLITLPLRPLFRVVEDDEGSQHEMLIGKPCVIRSEAANLEYGQAEVRTEGAPNLVNVRTRQETPLARGEEAVIVDYDAAKNVYVVASIDWEA
ncbi:MAG: hypothetical protein AAF581_09950 [Planctomycetota bacterium]